MNGEETAANKTSGSDGVASRGQDRCLESALWCFARTDCYADAVLLAANLGDDADTTAAVVGQLAGAFYGSSAIPPEWRRRVSLGQRINSLADALWANEAKQFTTRS
jgi:ADP-ribosyl-[dinitrogen reductase] hydrolase